MLYPCMFCLSLSMDLFVLCDTCLTGFVNCVFVCPKLSPHLRV